MTTTYVPSYGSAGPKVFLGPEGFKEIVRDIDNPLVVTCKKPLSKKFMFYVVHKGYIFLTENTDEDFMRNISKVVKAKYVNIM